MAGSELEIPAELEQEQPPEVEQLRAEVERLRGQLAEAKPAPPSRRWRRRWLSITCAVLAAILLPVAVFTVWARNTVLDTNEYVSTVAPLADDEDIQEAVTFRVTEAVAEAADFRSIAEEGLPEDAQVLAGPIEAGAKTLTSEVVGAVVASEEFSQLWREANRVAHENLAPLLRGEGNDLVATAEGRVVLNLGSVAADAVAQLDERLDTDLVSQIPEDQLDAELVLVDSDELSDVQGLVGLMDSGSWFSVILALALFVGAIAFAEQRRLGVRRLGIAVAIPMLLTIIAYGWIRDQYVTGLPDDVHNPDAAAAVFDITTRFAFRSLRTLLVVGLLVILGAWAVGPSTTAARLRSWWDTLLGRATESGAERELGPIPTFAAANERALLGGVAAFGALTLVLWTNPTGLVVLLIAVATLLLLGAVRVVAEVGGRPSPLPTIEDPTIDLRDSEPDSAPTEPEPAPQPTEPQPTEPL